MSRRKREITGLSNERDFPHLVELALPPAGFRSVFLDFDAFCRERRIPVRRGRSRREAEHFYIRFCFPDTATADAFRNRFGGECARSGRVARRGGGLEKRAVTELERKNLVETDRHIAACKEYIAKQRELIERAIQLGRSTEVAETTLEALEASLRAFERQRRLLLDRLKERERWPFTGKNRIMIFGPKTDGTYVVEFRTAEGAVLTISIPRTEAGVIRHFQERMPYGLFVPDVPWGTSGTPNE
jgi:hypothetical protein